MGKEQDLILAVRNQDMGFLTKLLHKSGRSSLKLKHKSASKKVNVNYQDGDGMSGLHQAALMGHTEIMELLLENGAHVDIRDNKGMVPLHYAAWQGKTEPVHILLHWKSPSNEQALAGETPLHLACQHGHFDVVNLLLLHQATPTLQNRDKKTPLDLASEFGRYRVVDLLLRSNLCSSLLTCNLADMTENKTTCLHLAAKNGHSDIIRLLLQGGMNINRTTLQGTCLHEAALFGKTDVVRLLLDCGVDVNKVNSYDQTALDIVNKFTTSHASKEIKQLLKEASFSVQAKAVRDHCNIYDPTSLTFKDGDLIKIVEQRQDGMWRGSLMKEGCMAKPGWFPADHVVLFDHSAGRKRQHLNSTSSSYYTPPATPDKSSLSSSHGQSFTYNDVHVPPPPEFAGPPYATQPQAVPGSSLLSSRNSYGSVGHDEAFPPPPSPTCMSKFEHVNDASVEGGKEASVLPPPPPPSYQNIVNNNNQHVNGKVIVNHMGEHCYVDNVEPAYQNSWDMRSSSPASSNRNSAASSDSGRGLSTNYLDPKNHHNYVNVHVNNQYRLSGTSYESGVSSRQSYHSTSSSSVGSLDRLEESGYSSQINVAELFQAGVPDHEVLRAWLRDLNYEEYYQNFMQAGYDMPTITHMTPQDLTAIGISKPGHRKKLKSEIARLNIHDGIPDFQPNDLYDWLRMLNLEQYFNTLANQGYDNIDYVTDITWEDLEEIGIQRLGHQKKIMLAIDRLKRITSGSKRLSTIDGQNRDSQEVLEPPMSCIRWSGERSSPPPPAPPQYNELPPYLKPRRSSSGDSLSTNSSGEMKSLGGQPLESEYANTSNTHPAVVPIKVKRSMSQSTPNGMGEKEAPHSHPKMCQSFHAPPDRTSDYSDRENTPTGDDPDQMSRSPMGMTPVAPLVAAKPKPVAMIVAKAKQSSREGSPDIIDIEKHEAERNTDGYKSPVKNLDGFKFPLASNNGSLKRRTSEHIYDTPQLGPPRTVGNNYVNYAPISMHQVQAAPGSPLHVSTGFNYSQYPQQAGSPRNSQQNSPGARIKKAPPPPPKRSASIRTVETASASKPASNSGNSPALTAAIASSPMTSVLAPPPVQQKPQNTGNQAQAFVNCVQSLSERFGKKSEDNSGGESMSSDNEEQAPPVAMEIIEPKISNYGLLGKNDKATSGEYMLQQRLKRDSSSSTGSGNNTTVVESAFGVKLRQASNLQNQSSEQCSTGSDSGNATAPSSQSSVHVTGNDSSSDAQACVQPNSSVNSNDCNSVNSVTKDSCNQASNNSADGKTQQRKDSTGSAGRGMDLSASTSSLDSNTLPFANENVGTIKQRAQQSKPSLVMFLDDDSDSPPLSGDFSQVTDTLKRMPNKLPKPQQPKVQTLQQSPPVKPKPKPSLTQPSVQQNHQQTQQNNFSKNPPTLPKQQQVQAPRMPEPQGAGAVGVQRQQQSPNAGVQKQQSVDKQQQQARVNGQGQHYNASATASYIPGTPTKTVVRPSLPTKPGLKPALSPKPQLKAGQLTTSGKKSGDVLSEIDNMLQGLTDELDAMLDIDLEEGT